MKTPRYTVLVVDDEPAIRLVLRAIFDHLDCATIVAADGSDALAVATGRRFDFAIVDQHMPNLEGSTVCRLLAKVHPRAVFVLTSGVPESLERTPGIDFILPKPYGLRAIEALLDDIAPHLSNSPDGGVAA